MNPLINRGLLDLQAGGLMAGDPNWLAVNLDRDMAGGGTACRRLRRRDIRCIPLFYYA